MSTATGSGPRLGLTAGLLGGALFAAISTTVLGAFAVTTWTGAVVAGVLAGLFFGALLGVAMARVARAEVAVTGAPAAVRLQASALLSMHPAFRDRVEHLPAGQLEPARAAALGLGAHRLRRITGWRSPLIVFAVLFVLAVPRAVVGPWWWVLPPVFFVAMAVVTVVQVRWLRRRLAQLSAEAGGGGPCGPPSERP